MAGVKSMKQTMFDEFQLKGDWWFPKNKTKVSGILYFSSDSIRLELIGILGDQNESPFGLFSLSERESSSCIFGFTDKGEKITLMDSINIDSKFNAPGFPTETYSVHSFLVGGHFDNFNEAKFHSMSFYPTNFTKWMNKVPFDHTYGVDENNFTGFNKVEFKSPTLFQEFVESIQAEIKECYNFNLKGHINTNVDWVYQGGFTIVPSEWQPLDWFENNMYSLKNLFTLLIGSPAYLESIIFYGEDSIVVDGKRYREKFAFFTRQSKFNLPKKFNSFNAIINYTDIDDFNLVLNSWFNKHEALKPVFDLYFSDFYSKLYLHSQFLNAIQTIEIYHRKTYDGKLFDVDYYEKNSSELKDYLKLNFPDTFAEKVEQMLLHGNEYSLSKRLREIFKYLDPDTKSKMFGNSDNRNRFIQQVVDTRNYLTHYDMGNKQNVLEEAEELYLTVQRLKALSTLIIFTEIGITEKLIFNKIMENQKYSSALVNAKKVLNK